MHLFDTTAMPGCTCFNVPGCHLLVHHLEILKTTRTLQGDGPYLGHIQISTVIQKKKEVNNSDLHPTAIETMAISSSPSVSDSQVPGSWSNVGWHHKYSPQHNSHHVNICGRITMLLCCAVNFEPSFLLLLQALRDYFFVLNNSPPATPAGETIERPLPAHGRASGKVLLIQSDTM